MLPLPSSLVYLQACSICKADFVSENRWLSHLIQEDHQKLARKECLEKWNRKMRKSCLIIFTKVPLTQLTAGKVVNCFSKMLTTRNSLNFVSDFIWWEDRPHVGVLQFESKKKVNDVLIALEPQSSKTIQIDDVQRIKLKAGFELTSIEWLAIFPPTSHRICSQTEDTQNLNTEIPTKIVSNEDLGQAPKPLRPDNNNIIQATPTQPSQGIEIPSLMHSDRAPFSTIMTSLTHPLQFEFWEIRKAMIIEDHQYENIKRAMHSLKSILPHCQLDSNLEVYLFRHWFLKLKYPSAKNDVHLYVHSNKASQGSNIFLKFVSLAKKFDSAFKVVNSRKEVQLDVLCLKYEPIDFNIFLMISRTKEFQLEVQVCHLMEYMCLFDRRCYPMITLACYWVTINGINVGGTFQTETASDLPPHYTLQWLVLFYMYNQGYIPTPQQILERCKTANQNGDGFNCDPNFVEEWKFKQRERLAAHQKMLDDVEESSEEFILSLLQLFKKFLLFCHSELSYKDDVLILNLVNGVIIEKKYLLFKPAKKYSHISNMTIEEIEVLCKAISDAKVKQQLEKCGLYITHPILSNLNLPVTENIKFILKLLGKGTKKIDWFLSQSDKIGLERSLKKMGGLKCVLIIKD